YSATCTQHRAKCIARYFPRCYNFRYRTPICVIGGKRRMSKSKEKGEPEMKEPASSVVQEAAEPSAISNQPAAEASLPAETAPGETLEWVVSFKASTGELVKIEKLDKASGSRQELTPEEYAEVAAKSVPVPELTGEAVAEHNAAHVALQAHIAAVSAAAYYQG